MGIIALLGVIFYYGWPILEAIILILPIPDPKHSIEFVKGLFGSVFGFVNSFLTSAPRQQSSAGAGPSYSQNLSEQPEAFMAAGDDSDEDIGMGRPNGLDYDSDEKDDDLGLTAAP